MSATRSANLLGAYVPNRPTRLTEFYVAVSTREDGREYLCVLDGAPLFAAGGGALEWLEDAAATAADAGAANVRIVRFSRRTEYAEYAPRERRRRRHQSARPHGAAGGVFPPSHGTGSPAAGTAGPASPPAAPAGVPHAPAGVGPTAAEVLP